jgi:predicted DNA binding CopG/RHH family protein
MLIKSAPNMEEDGDDELEEIEQEVFDLSQPNKKKKRTTNYTEIEDTSLVGTGPPVPARKGL